jgi:hypothetical protein
VAHRLLPSPSLAKPDGELAGIEQLAPAGRPPRAHISKPMIFPRASLQKVNSNSEVISMFLVNCVENLRKLRKMQN